MRSRRVTFLGQPEAKYVIKSFQIVVPCEFGNHAVIRLIASSALNSVPHLFDESVDRFRKTVFDVAAPSER